mmetsp:Transcript_32977/g.50451  ORF Transcript_32977/g.50451 Transcript_32977/m.50451 type:complete len:201 (-) Transcript_32977:763-1365(-)
MISRCSIINLDLHLLLTGQTKAYPRLIELKLGEKSIVKQFANALGDSGVVPLAEKTSTVSNLSLLLHESLTQITEKTSSGSTLEQFNSSISYLQESISNLRTSILHQAKLQFHYGGSQSEQKRQSQNLVQAMKLVTFLEAHLEKLPHQVDNIPLNPKHLTALIKETFVTKILGSSTSSSPAGEAEKSFYDLLRGSNSEDL